MQRVLITGAGRGIGLELARQYAARGDRVLAGCRAIARAPGLRVLVDQHRERVSILPLEVTDAGALAAAVQQTHQEVEGLDILINNAAINPSDATIPGPDGQQLLDEARALEVFRVNVVAAVRVAQAFTALLARGTAPRVVNISSGAGSLTRATTPAGSSATMDRRCRGRRFGPSAHSNGTHCACWGPAFMRRRWGGLHQERGHAAVRDVR